MADFPTSVEYRERLILDAAGNPAVFNVEIPTCRQDAFDQVRTLDRLWREDKAKWKLEYRKTTATCWYTLNLLLGGGQRLNPFTGRVEADCDFQFQFAREMQFKGGRTLDKSARGHFKTHWRGYVGLTNRICLDPDLVIIWAAHEKQAAFKHANRTALAWKNEADLKLAWDDVFWADPEKESELWNQDRGWTVKRKLDSALPTLSCWSIVDAPTGGRVGLYLFDDVEEESTVENDEQRQKLLNRFVSFLDLAGRLPEIWVNGTHFHPNGLVAHLERSGAWHVRCHKAEDTSRPAPDVAALYDECGGRWPNGEEIPVKVRDIRLDGAPVYLHALELAQKRLDNMLKPGGLANYFRQYMGDSLAGLEYTLRPDWIRSYKESPEDRAEGSTLLMTVDGSKGINDPTVALVWALHADESLSLVGGLRKKIPAGDFGRQIFNLWSAWEGFGIFDQLRVEHFAQAAYDWMIRSYFEGRHKDCPKLLAIGHPIEKRYREYSAIEPLLRPGGRGGGIWFPGEPVFDEAGKVESWVGGIMVEDENGWAYDLCDYAVKEELKPFPVIDKDDFVDSMALLGEPDNRKCEGGKMLVGPLPFPDPDAELRDAMRRGSQRPLARIRGGRGQSWDEGFWSESDRRAGGWER